MGQNISSEQINTHLGRQGDLIQQLQDVVEKQSRTIEIATLKQLEYAILSSSNAADKNGGGGGAQANPIVFGGGGGASSAFSASSTSAAATLRDEIEVMPSEARASENTRRELPISDEERKAPNIGWVEPTAEEEKALLVSKPWLASMAPPTNFEFGKTDDAPHVNLQLERVYGYRAAGARNTAHWLDANTVVYYVGAVGISLNLATNKQTFFSGHSDQICSIAVDRKRKIVATGESGRFPAIFVWNAVTGEQIAKIAGRHRRAVSALCFGRDGSTLASVGIDDSNTLLVYAWQSGKVIGEGSCRSRVLDITPNFTAGHNPNLDFITAGEEQVVFWSSAVSVAAAKRRRRSEAVGVNDMALKGVEAAQNSININNANGRSTSPSGGVVGDNNNAASSPADDAVLASQLANDLMIDVTARLGTMGVRQHFLCVRSTRSHTLVGCADGNLYGFRDDRLVFVFQCHQGPIHSLQIAALDGEQFDVLGEEPAVTDSRSSSPPPQQMANSVNSQQSPVGLSSTTATTTLAVPPEIRVFTAGRDGTIACWDIDQRSRELTVSMNKLSSYSSASGATPAPSASSLKFGTNAVRSLSVFIESESDAATGADGESADAQLKKLILSARNTSKKTTARLLVGTINGTLATVNARLVENTTNTTNTSGDEHSGVIPSTYAPIAVGHCADLSSHGGVEGELLGLAAGSAMTPVSEKTYNPATATRFATCGEDAMLRLWDSVQQRQLSAYALPRPAQCVAFSRDGHSLAVGYMNGAIGVFTIHEVAAKNAGGAQNNSGANSSGNSSARSPHNNSARTSPDHRRSSTPPPVSSAAAAAISSATVQIRELCEMRRCARRIQCLQYSPCGKWLAAGTADGNVDLYAITEDPFAAATTSAAIQRSGKIGGGGTLSGQINPGTSLNYTLKLRLANTNNSVCMRFDFSKDGRYVQACSQSYELNFYDTTQQPTESTGGGGGKSSANSVPQILPLDCATARAQLRDVEWFSFSSFLGWSVQGVWLSSHADGSDVSSVRRSHNSKYLLTGCDSGHIRLFNYPCVGSGLDREGHLARRPTSKALLAHGKHIADVAWSADDRRVFSIGASDRCVMQWRVVADVQ